MSFAYYVCFACEIGSSAIVAELQSRGFQLSTDAKSQIPYVQLRGRAVLLTFLPASERIADIRDEFGLAINQVITVDPLARFYTTDDGPFEIAKCVGAALSCCEGDLILLFNGEVPLLVRNGGEVVVDEQSPMWSKRNRDALDVEYVQRPLRHL